MEEITFNYFFDIPKLINKKIVLQNNNYRKKLYNINNLLNDYRVDYFNKEYGNILYNIKKEENSIFRWKIQYLASLEIFYNNNYNYFSNLNIVDMHGLYSQEMVDILDSLYYFWIEKNIKIIDIIIGNGNRILYKKLIEYLKKWNIKYCDNFSRVKISLDLHSLIK